MQANALRNICACAVGVFLFFPGLTFAQSMPKEVAFLLDKLENGRSFKTKIAAAYALGSLKQGVAVPKMVEIYNAQSDTLVKMGIIHGLATMTNADATAFLVGLSASTFQKELLAALDADLSSLADYFDTRSFERGLREEQSAPLRAQLAWVLGLVGDSATPPVLLAALGDASVPVRKNAVVSLKKLGALSALPRLEALLGASADAGLRTEISASIAALKAGNVSPRTKLSVSDGSLHAFTLAVYKQHRKTGGIEDRLSSALTALEGGRQRAADSHQDHVGLKTETSHQLAGVKQVSITYTEDDDQTVRTVSFEEFRPFLRETVNKVAEDCRQGNPQRLAIFGEVSISFALKSDGKVNTLSIGGTATKLNEAFKTCLVNTFRGTLFTRVPAEQQLINYSINIAKARDKQQLSFQ